MYRQVLDPVSNSLGASSLFAAIPLAVLFLLLGVFLVRAWLSALVSLAAAVIVATVVYPMPVSQALLSGTEGAAFGFFPILWIVINAIWIYNMTVATGHFDVLRRSFAKVSDDQRIQGVIIAFAFGALLEALAGFGTPVAISSVMLIALGFRPIKAATVALVANTAPVAFGALAVPITTLATVTDIPQDTLGAMVGRQTPLLGIFVPLALVFIIDGRRGVRQTWPAMLVAGGAFALAQFVVSNYGSIELTDIVASLASVVATVAFLRVWHPVEVYREEEAAERVAVGVGGRSAPAGEGAADTGGGPDRGSGAPRAAAAGPDATGGADSRADVVRAYAPYVVIIIVFAIAQIPAIKDALDVPTKVFNWPGLHLETAGGDPSTLPDFKLNWLGAAGTLLLISGLITIPILGIRPGRAVAAWFATYRQLAAAIVTVMAVLGLAYVMNASGQTVTLGSWMAGAGGLFALISPVLGWLGVAVTGSDTSSNSLFGALQVAAAGKAHLSATLLAGGNSSGGVLGKMISPQNLAIAAGAVGMSGREGDLFRRVVGWSVLFALLMCILVYLQSTPVLSWMVP
ncbi:MAG: L-lactate permease [Jatrophihabitantaceae bacterium]